MAFCLSGYLSAQWTAGLLLQADAWVPWCGLGAVVLARSSQRPGWSARAGAILAGAAPLAAAFLLGEIFIAAMGAMFAVITAAVDRWSAAHAGSTAAPAERGAAPLRWRPLLACAAAALALAGAVALVVVLPAARAAADTDRGRPLARAFAETASLHPIRLVELVAPQAMGVPYEHYPGGRWLNEADLDGTPLSYSMYLGASVFALAALAFGRGRRLALGLAVAAGFFLIVALGKHTPVHHGWRSVLRLMAYMRYPEKYMVLVTAWLSLLAGLGAARLLAGEVRVRRVLAVAGVLVAVVLAAGLYPAELAPYVRKGGLTGLGAVLGIAVALYLRPRRPLAAALLLPAVVVGDLAAAAVPMQHFGPARIATTVPDVVRAIQDQNRNIVPPPRAHRTRAAEFSVARRYRVASYAAGQARAMQVLVENASNTFGIALVPGYDAALPSAAMNAWAAGLRHGPGAMRLFAVPYAVFPEPGAPRSRPWQQALVPVMDPAPGARLYRLRDPLPRLYLTGRAELRPDPLRGSLDPAGWDPLFAPAVLDGSLAYLSPEPGVAGLEGPPGRAGICRFDLFQAHRIEATCRADREALAVFVEQHDPGWSAQVDGRAVPLLRANALFRAVRLAPGEHGIRLSFHPPGLAAGGAAALAALLAGLGLLVVWLRGRRGGYNSPVSPPEGGPPALDTPFDQVGGRPAVERLAARFYEVMERDEPELTAVHRQAEAGAGIDPEVKRRFALFLVGWLGGPQDYMAVHGHPRLRMRHAHVAIGPGLRDAWLRCMTRAMDDCGVAGPVRPFLDQRFAEVANFLTMDTGKGRG